MSIRSPRARLRSKPQIYRHRCVDCERDLDGDGNCTERCPQSAVEILRTDGVFFPVVVTRIRSPRQRTTCRPRWEHRE